MAQIWQLPREGGHPGDHFGVAVALDGDRALIGASGETVCGQDAGAAYIYERAAEGTFEPVARLQPGACRPGRFFGRAVALSGNLAAVAAGGQADRILDPNTVHLFVRNEDGDWTEAAVIHPPLGRERSAGFGASVELADGRLIVAEAGERGRAPRHGAVHVYEQDHRGWALVATLRPSADVGHGVFGSVVAAHEGRIAVSAPPRQGRSWGSVYVFQRRPDGTWYEEAHLRRLAGPVISVATRGALLVVGESGAGPYGAGAAPLFSRHRDGRWIRIATLRPTIPYEGGAFGSRVSIADTERGPRVLVVGYAEQLGRGTNVDRVVKVFAYDGQRGWRQTQTLDLGDWAFAMSVAHEGDIALIGRTSDLGAGAVFMARLF